MGAGGVDENLCHCVWMTIVVENAYTEMVPRSCKHNLTMKSRTYSMKESKALNRVAADHNSLCSASHTRRTKYM